MPAKHLCSNQHLYGVFDVGLERIEKLGTKCTIHDAVVAGQSAVHDRRYANGVTVNTTIDTAITGFGTRITLADGVVYGSNGRSIDATNR